MNYKKYGNNTHEMATKTKYLQVPKRIGGRKQPTTEEKPTENPKQNDEQKPQENPKKPHKTQRKIPTDNKTLSADKCVRKRRSAAERRKADINPARAHDRNYATSRTRKCHLRT